MVIFDVHDLQPNLYTWMLSWDGWKAWEMMNLYGGVS